MENGDSCAKKRSMMRIAARENIKKKQVIAARKDLKEENSCAREAVRT